MMINRSEYRIQGVRVERASPSGRPARQHPLVFVHGGCHGSWVWEHFLPYFSQAGWDCHALNWRQHNGSKELPNDQLVRRGIADVAEEIAHVAEQFEQPPILIRHSMGGLASQKYAEDQQVAALVLLASVVPAEVGGDLAYD
ncbi:MAG: alpha/beta fold hydrolase [Methylocella sp.]